MTTHTPGPWHKKGSRVYHQSNPGGLKTDIAECFRDVGGPLPCEANARLMAAAPDLLAALEAVMACNKELGAISRPIGNEARAAIAKAKGQT